MKQTAITGMGIVSCLGNQIDEVWTQLTKGISGLKQISMFDATRGRSQIGGEVTGSFPPHGYERMISFAKHAISQAIESAGLSLDFFRNNKSALILGTSLGHIFENEEEPIILDNFLNDLKNRLQLNIPSLMISTACSSGTDAISNGCDFIELQDYDAVICGGVDVLDIYKLMGHSSLHTLSPSYCAPFDQEGSGTALGEGAGIVILENYERAKASNRTVLARIVGRSSTTDTESITAPDVTGAGAIRVINQSLQQQGFSPENVTYINAHGSGTPTNDAMESNVYRELFLSTLPPISSTKSAFGHTLGATGAMECIISVYALIKQEAPPTANTSVLHENWKNANVVVGEHPQIMNDSEIAISVTYGFGGANACLALALDNEKVIL